MAGLLADPVYGNGSAFAEYKHNSHKPTYPLSDSKGGRIGHKEERHSSESCQPPDSGQTTRAILCSDGIDLANTKKEDLKGS